MSDLKKDVCAVVNGQDQSSNPGEVAGPGESHQGDGGNVMYEHLPKIFPLHVVKLKQQL
jgi:hypothetical protein